ncbi:MAG: hypothetical protein JKX86_03230 [Verrucomicrobiales bacterium]|jgi:hypothetical protein|nr:hypothetical protein [Verrucomicrobiales bacterium]|tara:strand:+ start:902 stop:1789 length:888 start_codon:yes stop_codon:yes gene_type:complete
MELVKPSISIENLKRRAKALAKVEGIQHSQALDRLSKENGFDGFNDLQRSSGRRREAFPGIRRSKKLQDYVLVSVDLLDVPVIVSRRILVPSTVNLEQLHGVIQIAMGWENGHLFSFEIENMPDIEYVGRFDEQSSDDDHQILKAADMSVRQLLEGNNSSLVYRYDFGDDWRHRVVIESVQAEWADRERCLLLDAKGLCPPEDCGGVSGYIGLLETFGIVEEPDDFRLRNREWTKKEISGWLGRAYRPDKPVRHSDFQSRLTSFAEEYFNLDYLYQYEPNWRYGGMNPNKHYRNG